MYNVNTILKSEENGQNIAIDIAGGGRGGARRAGAGGHLANFFYFFYAFSRHTMELIDYQSSRSSAVKMKKYL